MKFMTVNFLFASLLTLSTMLSAKAQSFTWVFCKKDDGYFISVNARNGWECRDKFLGAYLGSGTCFEGNPNKAVSIVNSLNEKNYFNGAGGEYIKDATYLQDEDKIEYTFVDSANDVEDTGYIKRCSN